VSAGSGPGAEGAEARREAEAGGLREHLHTLAVAVLVALAVRAFVIEPFRIPSGSMLPTLLIGDHLFVNKFVYGVKIPFSDRRLPGLREPRRGDVVVFTVARGRAGEIVPVDRADGLRHEEFVKRIVGLPGDRIAFRGESLLVNGEVVPTEPLGETLEDELHRELRVQRAGLPGCPHLVLDDPDVARADPPLVTVPEGRYFLLGDNRDHSNDSRGWGTVRLAEIKGPAFVLYWSWAWNGSWLELLSPLTWWELLGERMRWDRIGDGVGCGAPDPEGGAAAPRDDV